MKDFKDLKVWQKAHELTIAIYSVSRAFPRDEIYGLTSQLRRAAVSIGANIAEGCGRRSDGEFVRFLQIARGSASEVEYHLLLSRDLKFMDDSGFQNLQSKLMEVQRMLTSLVSAIEQKGTKAPAKARGARAG
jgi:four helix bundle protein